METPFIKTENFTLDGWSTFLEEFEVYRARGGRSTIPQLVSSSIVDFIALTENVPIAELQAGDRLVRAINVLFAPRSKEESRSRFAAIKMVTNPLSLIAYSQYVMRWQGVEKQTPQDLLPGARTMTEIFIAGLGLKALKDEFAALEIDNSNELRRRGLKIISDYISVQERVRKLSGHAPHSSGTASAAGGTPVQRPREKEKIGITCYNCGKLGHYANDCRSAPRRDAAETAERPPPQTPLPTPRRLEPPTVARPPPPPFTPRGVTTRSMNNKGGARLNVVYASPIEWKPVELPKASVKLSPNNADIFGNRKSIRVQALLDSGSTHNILSESLAMRLVKQGATMEPVRYPVRLAGAQIFLHSQGVISASVEFGDKKEVLEFLVLNTDYSVILGYPSLSTLGIIQLAAVNVNPQDSPGDTEFSSLLQEYQELFNEDLSAGPARVTPFSISLTDEKPVSCLPRRQPLALQELISEQVHQWVQQGIIEESTSPYNAPIVMVKKKDNTFRTCIDFRGLNKKTVPYPFPMQCIGSIFERLAGSSWFCKLDLTNGFLQVPLDPASKPLTSFSTEDGHFQFTRLPFGLRNSPLHFQSVMNGVLGDVLHRGVETFMDDLVIHAGDKQELLTRLRVVFGLLQAKGLKLKASKCVFGVREVEFLGHTVSADGVAVSNARVEALRNIEKPQTVKQLRQFLGAYNYVRDYLKDFSTVAAPLFSLLSGPKAPKNRPITWTHETTSAFELVKGLTYEIPVLHFIDQNLPLVLECDASEKGLGSVLFQIKDEKVQVVQFVSKAFKGPSINWSVSEKESYAVYYSVTKLRHFLLGRSFVIRSDHKNMLFQSNSAVPKILNWALRMQEYDYVVEYIKGTSNTVADSLSRLNALDGTGEELDSHSKEDLISRVHGQFSGHHGVSRTIKFLRLAGHSWSGLDHDVRDFVEKCAICAKMKNKSHPFSVSFGTTMASRPFEMMSLDLVGPMMEDALHNTYILVAIDHFSRFVFLKAIPNKTAAVVSQGILDVIGLFGIVPKTIRTDHGPEFVAGVTQSLLQALGKTETTVTDHPESNGMVERVNQEVLKHLRCLTAEHNQQSSWSAALPLVQRCINSSPNRTTGFTPSEILFGIYGVTSPSLFESQRTVPHASLQEMFDSQTKILECARQNQQLHLEQYLKDSPPHSTLDSGCLVLALHRGDTPPSKLSSRYKGPYKILRKTGTNRYLAQHLATKHQIDVHLDHLRKWTASQEEAQQAAELDAHHLEYQVDAIVQHKFSTKQQNQDTIRFRLRWLGWGPEHDSWRTFDQVSSLEALDRYLGDNPDVADLLYPPAQPVSQQRKVQSKTVPNAAIRERSVAGSGNRNGSKNEVQLVGPSPTSVSSGLSSERPSRRSGATTRSSQQAC